MMRGGASAVADPFRRPALTRLPSRPTMGGMRGGGDGGGGDGGGGGGRRGDGEK